VPNSNNGGSNGGPSTPSTGPLSTPSVSNLNVWSVRLIPRKNGSKDYYVEQGVSEIKARQAYNNEKKYKGTNGEFYSRVELLKENIVVEKFTFPYKIGEGGFYTPTPMATGGYTGDFGPEGRMAILHEKELVLNKQDTANMLKMVNIAREVLNNANLGLPFV